MVDEAWQRPRAQVGARIEALTAQGICYSCRNLETGEVFPDQIVAWDDPAFVLVLEEYPRMRGHTVVVWKAHRSDFSELGPEEQAQAMRVCCAAARALRRALGAEKVYLNAMCDGEINHLHFQLFPRYPGDPIGSRRFVLPRQPAEDAPATAAAVRAAFGALWRGA